MQRVFVGVYGRCVPVREVGEGCEELPLYYATFTGGPHQGKRFIAHTPQASVELLDHWSMCDWGNTELRCQFGSFAYTLQGEHIFTWLDGAGELPAAIAAAFPDVEAEARRINPGYMIV